MCDDDDDDGDGDDKLLSQLSSPDYLPGVVLTCCTLYLIPPHTNLLSRDLVLTFTKMRKQLQRDLVTFPRRHS